jgi:hypothetical protein
MSQTKRLSQLNAAESWLNSYRDLVNADFKAYDFESLREALLDHIQVNYGEDFNDFINSSEYVALVDLISFLGQNIAFRADLNLRETFLETAEVRENVLSIARQIGYKPHRNKTAEGFLRINSISSSQEIYDSRGVNLAGQNIVWADPLNSDFQEQFNLILNEAFSKSNPIGRPISTFQSGAMTREIYEFEETDDSSLIENVSLNSRAGQSYTFDIIPVTLEDGALIESPPSPLNAKSLTFNNDGTGFAGESNGWFFSCKQGTLQFQDIIIDNVVENRVIDINANNINDTDVWVQTVDQTGTILTYWTKVESVVGNNISFNDIDKEDRNIFEIITRTNDQISIKFGNGSFGNVPFGNIRIWFRVSANEDFIIQKGETTDVDLNLVYVDSLGQPQEIVCNISPKNNMAGIESESITDIKNNASRTAASQNRMITADDYNNYPQGKVSGISRIKSINRIHTGQSLYSDLADPTASYRPVITLADDAFLYTDESTVDTKIADSVGTNKIMKWLLDTLQYRPLHQLYYRRFTPISPANPVYWKTVDTTIGSTHGYFTGNVDPKRIGRSSVEQDIRTLKKNSLVRLADLGWYKIQDVFRDGFGLTSSDGVNTGKRANGEGAVFIEGISANQDVVSWMPNLRVVFTDGEKRNILDELQAQRNFGLRYDHVLDDWKIINADEIVTEGNFDSSTVGTSWLLRFTHSNDSNTWTATTRRDIVVLGSESQIVFHNQKFGQALDSVTRRVIQDTVQVLSSSAANNPGVTRRAELEVSDYFTLDDGRYDPKRVIVQLPGISDDLIPKNPNLFSLIFTVQGVSQTIELVEKEFDDAEGQFTLAPRAINDITTPSKTVTGRQSLTIQHNHVPLRENRVDATTTNIIDMFVLTDEYDSNFRNWLATGTEFDEVPTTMTSTELSDFMSSITPYKSVSDTIIYHPIKYKIIFGENANIRDQVTIRVTRSDGTKVSNAEVRSRVIASINDYFSVENWDFGETFYFTDMAAWIHQQLAGVVSSVALVPVQATVSVSDIFQIKCEENELFISSATADNIEIITTEQVPLPRRA